MPEAPSFLPTEPFRMVVEEGKVHEFAQATRSDLAEHLRERDPVSPVTFLAASQLWMQEQNLAWRGVQRDFATILHGEQEFVFHGPPPRAGTELTGQQEIDRVYQKQGRRGGAMTFTEAVTRFWTSGSDQPLVEMRSVSISRSAAPPEADGAAGGASDAEAGELRSVEEPREAPAEAAAEAFPAFVDEPLTVTDFVRYQGASGDFNAIHHDNAFAQAAGYPSPFAVGMLTAAIAANRVTERFGADSVRRYAVRWSDQAWPGDVLTYTGVLVTDHAGAQGDRKSDVELRATRADGTLHLRAWVELQPGTTTY
jgi:acyl dehydratase